MSDDVLFFAGEMKKKIIFHCSMLILKLERIIESCTFAKCGVIRKVKCNMIETFFLYDDILPSTTSIPDVGNFVFFSHCVDPQFAVCLQIMQRGGTWCKLLQRRKNVVRRHEFVHSNETTFLFCPQQYLDFDNLPETNFSCQGKVIGGYYADVEAGCQMFHVCTVGQKGGYSLYYIDMVYTFFLPLM